MVDVDAVVAQREVQYGGFGNVARMSQALKIEVQRGKGLAGADDVQLEALSMILHKVARLVCGGCNQLDTWQDIAGYATLVAADILRKIEDGAEV